MKKKPLLILFFIGYFIVNFNLSFLYPLLPSIKQHFSGNEKDLALLLAAFPTLALFSNLFLGPFIDKFGKEKFYIIGTLGCMFCFVGTVFINDIKWVIIFRFLSGMFVPMLGATIFPLIVENFEGKEKLFASGVVQGAASVAQLIALPIGVISGDTIPWHIPFTTLFSLSFISFVIGILFLRIKHTEHSEKINLANYLASYKFVFIQKPVFLYISSYTLYGFAVFIIFSMYPLWLLSSGRITNHQIALMFIITGIIDLLASVSINYFSNFFSSTQKFMRTLIIISIVSVALIPFFPTNLIAQVILFSIFTWVRACFSPLLFVEIYSLVSRNERSTLNGLMNASFQLATSCGGIIGTWFYYYSTSFILNTAIFCLSVTLCLLVLTGIKTKLFKEIIN
ncbi:MFS transporter [Pectobacterium polaris]|uniref:MFS transporter n=1 Tax=Pectobacterium polaris TaxID=2042057 RepID=UPI001582AEED|nr:MFS transporter [Pectobacterium polaris]